MIGASQVFQEQPTVLGIVIQILPRVLQPGTTIQLLLGQVYSCDGTALSTFPRADLYILQPSISSMEYDNDNFRLGSITIWV